MISQEQTAASVPFSVLEHAQFVEFSIIKVLALSDELRPRIQPIIGDEIFRDTIAKTAYGAIHKFIAKYGKFPTPYELQVESIPSEYASFLHIMQLDISKYSRSFFFSILEEYIKIRKMERVFVEVGSSIATGGAEAASGLPKQMQEILDFRVEPDSGVGLYDNPDTFYDSLQDANRVSTGNPQIDRASAGGHAAGTLTVYVGAPNIGKTLTMGDMAVKAAALGKRVMYFSGEMAEAALQHRFIANQHSIPMTDLKRWTKAQVYEFFNHQKMYNPFADYLKIIRRAGNTFNTNDIRLSCEDYRRQYGAYPDELFVDYIGLVNPNEKSAHDNSNDKYGKVAVDLRALAIELDIPVVSAHQLSRDAMKDLDADMDKIAGAISITHHADNIWVITQDEELLREGKYRFRKTKCRDGFKFKVFLVPVMYQYMRLVPTPIHEEPEPQRAGFTQSGPVPIAATAEFNNLIASAFGNTDIPPLPTEQERATMRQTNPLIAAAISMEQGAKETQTGVRVMEL